MTARVVTLPVALASPTADQLVARIRSMAEAGRMQFDHPHFQERLHERHLSMRHVLETVSKGLPVGNPKLDQWGEWRVKLKRLVAGRRVQVVVAVKYDYFVAVTVT